MAEYPDFTRAAAKILEQQGDINRLIVENDALRAEASGADRRCEAALDRCRRYSARLEEEAARTRSAEERLGARERDEDARLAIAEARGAELTDLLRATFGVYDAWWHNVGTYDPGKVLVSDGTTLTGIASLLDFDDSLLMEDACEAVELHEERIRELLGEQRTCSCDGRRWVDDENWQPDQDQLRRGRQPADGLIPCGFCNEGGWDVDPVGHTGPPLSERSWYAMHDHGIGRHQHFPENVTPGEDHDGVPLVPYSPRGEAVDGG